MKKILTTALFFLVLVLPGLINIAFTPVTPKTGPSLPAYGNTAQTPYKESEKTESPLVGRLSLDPQLRPKHAPDFGFKNTSGNEVAYVNFVLQTLAGGLLYLAGPMAIFFIVFGAQSYVVAHGKTEEMEKAKKTITYAIIGLVVIILSYAIIQAVINLVIQTAPPPTYTTRPQ